MSSPNPFQARKWHTMRESDKGSRVNWLGAKIKIHNPIREKKFELLELQFSQFSQFSQFPNFLKSFKTLTIRSI